MTARRRFLKTLAAGSLLPLPLRAETKAVPLRIGLITDVHKDIMHDADFRLQTFIDAMSKTKVDAIMQLGDFCVPKSANQGFLDIWNSFKGPRHHVIGNHDTDGGFKREQVVGFWGMPSRYYSYDLGGFHFIVLDANDRPEGFKGGYPSSLAADQLEWLKQDLAKTRLNTFVVTHQSLEADLTNRGEVRTVLEAAKTTDGNRKVAACLNGHWHIDRAVEINAIPYIHINSASYLWVGSGFKRERLDPVLAKAHPYVSSTIPYTDPVFTILEIDPAAGTFSLAASESRWMGPGPDEIGYPPADSPFKRGMLHPGIRALKRGLP
jgi:3',5'-cyclic AMP phosphodiesterase CpdA